MKIRYVIQNVRTGLFLTEENREFTFNDDLLVSIDFDSEEEAISFIEVNAKRIRLETSASYRLRIDKWIKIQS